MKTATVKYKFSWTAFVIVFAFFACTFFITKLFDGFSLSEVFSLKSVLKEIISAICFATIFVLVLKPSFKKKS